MSYENKAHVCCNNVLPIDRVMPIFGVALDLDCYNDGGPGVKPKKQLVHYHTYAGFGEYDLEKQLKTWTRRDLSDNYRAGLRILMPHRVDLVMSFHVAFEAHLNFLLENDLL